MFGAPAKTEDTSLPSQPAKFNFNFKPHLIPEDLKKDAPEDDEVEKIESPTVVKAGSQEKLFQKPIVSVRQTKLADRTIDSGFVSVEKVESQTLLIHRSFAGKVHLSGLITKKTQVKEEAIENNQKAVKVRVFMLNAEEKKYEPETLVIQFVDNDHCGLLVAKI